MKYSRPPLLNAMLAELEDLLCSVLVNIFSNQIEMRAVQRGGAGEKEGREEGEERRERRGGEEGREI